MDDKKIEFSVPETNVTGKKLEIAKKSTFPTVASSEWQSKRVYY